MPSNLRFHSKYARNWDLNCSHNKVKTVVALAVRTAVQIFIFYFSLLGRLENAPDHHSSAARGGVTHGKMTHGNRPVLLSALEADASKAAKMVLVLWFLVTAVNFANDVNDEMALSPIQLMLLQTAVFVFAWASVSYWVKQHGPIPGARAITTANSRFYAVASVAMLILTLSPRHEALARQVYHASKFYEYLDILNVRASGGEIDLHFGFHHLTTPYLTFFRVLGNSPGWRPFATLNLFHHALMYAFFGGAQWSRIILPYTGYLQLVVGILAEFWALASAPLSFDTQAPHIFCLVLLSTYLILWTRDLRMRRKEKTS